MKNLKKGDIVVRKSYERDIIFIINSIIEINHEKIAILKGLTIRVEADSPLYDLELLDTNEILKKLNDFEQHLEKQKEIIIAKQNTINLKRNDEGYGKILHLDGDKRYSEKSEKFYKNMKLNVVIKNIPESKQPLMITSLLDRYNPDILVVTGHDGMIRKGCNFNDIYNYRNSRYFVETVVKARMWEQGKNKMAIFAGACQSYYEALIEAGASFASSPARVLIDFKDPLIVAQKIAITDSNEYITINKIVNELRDGENGVSGIGTYGKKKSR